MDGLDLATAKVFLICFLGQDSKRYKSQYTKYYYCFAKMFNTSNIPNYCVSYCHNYINITHILILGNVFVMELLQILYKHFSELSFLFMLKITVSAMGDAQKAHEAEECWGVMEPATGVEVTVQKQPG